MKPFARIADAHGQDRSAPDKSAKADHVERQWVIKNGRLECRYVIVRCN